MWVTSTRVLYARMDVALPVAFVDQRFHAEVDDPDAHAKLLSDFTLRGIAAAFKEVEVPKMHVLAVLGFPFPRCSSTFWPILWISGLLSCGCAPLMEDQAIAVLLVREHQRSIDDLTTYGVIASLERAAQINAQEARL